MKKDKNLASWFAMLNMDCRRAIEKKYNCPNCGDFVVYHKEYESVNKTCFYCGSAVTQFPEEKVVICIKNEMYQKSLTQTAKVAKV